MMCRRQVNQQRQDLQQKTSQVEAIRQQLSKEEQKSGKPSHCHRQVLQQLEGKVSPHHKQICRCIHTIVDQRPIFCFEEYTCQVLGSLMGCIWYVTILIHV